MRKEEDKREKGQRKGNKGIRAEEEGQRRRDMGGETEE